MIVGIARLLLFAGAWCAAAGARAAEPSSCPRMETLDGEPATPGEWRARIDAARGNYEAFACRARLDRETRAAERARAREAPSGKIEEFVGDGTMRRGDVVVTDKGFRVFDGPADQPVADDFKPVAAGIKKPSSRRTLDEMEKASGFRPEGSAGE